MSERPYLPAPTLPPAEEARRLQALDEMAVLDTGAEAEFDHVVALVSRLIGAPVSLVSLVDEKRQWFKARVGLSATETAREISFCGHAITSDHVFYVEDAHADPRFAQNPLVTGAPHVRFYLGAPLVTSAGDRLGTLCAIDSVPRVASAEDIELIRGQARLIVSLLESRRQTRQLRDLTSQLEHQKAELQKSRETLRAFTFSLTHDLAAPVRFVQAFGQRLAKRLPNEPELVRILTAADRMQRMVIALREFAQASGTMERTHVNLAEAAAVAMELLESDIADSGATVSVDAPHRVLGHPVFVGQVLQNLIGNALKYRGSQAPEIAVSSTESDGVVRVEVVDNGMGIAPKFQDEVFVPLRRLHGPAAIPGTGLGLSLCRQVIEELGGEIGLTSEEGVGTTVWFTLAAHNVPERQ